MDRISVIQYGFVLRHVGFGHGQFIEKVGLRGGIGLAEHGRGSS